MDDLTYTIWSNDRKFEWIVRRGDETVKRSGLIFRSRNAAKRDMLKTMGEQ